MPKKKRSISSSRRWPCKTFAESELAAFGGSAWRLFLSDRDRVDLGEATFYRLAQRIPLWITPNAITRTGLALNVTLFLISFIVAPAVDREMGDWAAAYVPSIVAVAMATLQVLVCVLDNFDGLHARGTNQCSSLGALLDHYFDSISIALNSMAMVLLLNAPQTVCVVGIVTGPVIFNLQLLTNYYLRRDPRVAGPEAQLACGCTQLIVGVLFLFGKNHILVYVSWAAAVVAALCLCKYVASFAPRLAQSSNRVAWQISLFWLSYAVVCAAYVSKWISTFEVCICGLFIAWDLNGQIVTHLEAHKELPLFNVAPYLAVPIGVALEFWYWNPLLELVDSKNNIHLTTLAIWAVLALKNVAHFRRMAALLVDGDGGKGKAAAAKSKKKNKVRKE